MQRILFLLLLPFLLYATPQQEEAVKQALHQKFETIYPTLTIERIEVKPSSGLIKRLHDFQVDKVTITKDNLRRAKGNVLVTLKKGEKKRKVYFKYQIFADIALYKTNRPIQRGSTITPNDVSLATIPFKTLYHKPLTDDAFYHYVAKQNIKEDRIVTLEKLKRATDIQRNDKVTAVIKDGALALQFQVKALQDGNVGDIIRVRKDYKKQFKARVISNTQVEIIE